MAWREAIYPFVFRTTTKENTSFDYSAFAGICNRRHWCPRRDSNPHGRSHLILSQARLPIPSLGQIKRICLFLDHQHQWVRSNYEFQKLTKVILFCYRPVSGFTGKPIRVFVFSLFKTRILYKNRPLEFPFYRVEILTPLLI